MRKAGCSPFGNRKFEAFSSTGPPIIATDLDGCGYLSVSIISSRAGVSPRAGFLQPRGQNLVPLSPINRPFLAATGATFLAMTTSAHTCRPGRHLVKGQVRRDAGVLAQQGDHVGDDDVAERLDGTVVKPFGTPRELASAIALVDDLLAFVGE